MSASTHSCPSATDPLQTFTLSAQTASNAVDTATSFKIAPLRPVAELRAEALKQSPPQESGDFLPTDLVELNKLDPTIKLEIRYATANNFMHTPLYPVARVFLRAPAARALEEVERDLAPRGLGLKVFDGYRPYSVTVRMWEPIKNPDFVADPAKGSRHNRGAAVDLTLIDLKSGAELAELLKNLVQLNPEQAVVIRGDETGAYKNIISVLNICTEAGVTNVAFATAR